MAPKPWRLRREIPAGPAPWKPLAAAWDLTPAGARLAWLRGVDRPEDLAWRLDPGWHRTTDPHLLPGVDAAVARIRQALEARERMVVYGDYDADGLTATALLVRTLERLGAEVSWFIPDRFSDGYGLHLDCIQELKAQRDPRLLISVDCGVRSVAEVEASTALGLDWIITDHHAPGPVLPPACAVVHPQLGDYGNPHLAGVGVAFKLAQALLGAAPQPGAADAPFLDGLLKLVALGTVADMAPLAGENALLVRRGLDGLAGRNAAGLAALLKSRRQDRPLGAQDIAFGLGPRLNAVGRMGSAAAAVDLLLCRDAEGAAGLMAQVEAANEARRITQKELSRLLPPVSEAPFDLVVQEGAHRGVLGIVAGRRMRESGRPTGVCTLEDGVAHGSLRAPEGYDLGVLLARAQPFLLGGGGHRAAAGVSFPRARLPFVLEAFRTGAAAQAADRRPAPVAVDGGPGELPEAPELARLEPFGQGFPPPLAVVEGRLQSRKPFSEHHWNLSLDGLADRLTWFAGEDRPEVTVGEHLCLAVTPQESSSWGRSWVVDQALAEAVP